MKTKIKFLAMMLMGIMLSTNVWGTTYTKVTSAPTDWSGEYLLVYEGDNTHSAVAWTGVDAVKCGAEVTISGGSITTKPDGAVSLIIASMEGGYSIKINGGTNNNKYIDQTSYANGLAFSDEASANTLSISDGTAVISGSGASGDSHVTMRYNYNSDQLRFRYYKSGQQAIALYKKEPDCTTDLAAPEVTATPGNGSATLTWADVANATNYTVTCAGATIGSITGEGTKTCTLTGLTNGTPYTWKVKAIGGGIYCDSEEASGNVTPSANHTVTWYVDGFVYTTGTPTTEVVHGGKVTALPSQPAVPTACTGSAFVGWTDHEVTNGNKPSLLFKDAASAPTVNADVSYHAVFADPE